MGFFKKIKKFLNHNNEVKAYDRGLLKTREGFISKLDNLNKKFKQISNSYYDELEEILITADIGVKTVLTFIDKIKVRINKEKITNPQMLTEIIIDELFIMYLDEDLLTNKINYNDKGPTVFLFVGVNGVGKTTTIAKMAYKLINNHKRVLLVAGDTFRKGAIEQLQAFGQKLNLKVVSKGIDSDPSSVIYDGVKMAIDEKYDVVLIDTAGRLQNKINLMNELAKINKVIAKLIYKAPHETLLVIDATTGQNGINQALAFKEVTNISGLVLTKLDGTAKGGIVLAIKEKVNIPVKYVGLGEKLDDLKDFDLEKYIYGLFKDLL